MKPSPNPLAQLVTVTATDSLQLPALFFEPAKPSKRIIIWLHGMGSSGIFYSTNHTNALAAAFTASGTAFLGLQNRGGGMLQSVRYFDKDGVKQKRLQGTTHELIADCVYDVDGALAFAKANGYNEIYLGGHSTGANKIALYNYLKPKNPFTGYVLYGGGDDTGLNFEMLGPRRHKAALTGALRKISAGQGAELAPLSLLGYHVSYQSTYDILNPDGSYNVFPFHEAQNSRLGTKPLFREFKSITKPTLVIYGALDEYCLPDVPAAINILKRECSDPAKFTFDTVPGADHGCYRHEPEVAKKIAAWVEGV